VAGNFNLSNPDDKKAIETALGLAETKRFFHWELEFPEVFYDETKRKDNGGFDAVVGNPPYVRQEGLGDDKIAFQANYKVFSSIADLYTYFIERGHMMLRPNGRFGMITANKFMRANYGAALRSFLTAIVRLETLIDFGELRVFGDAATDPLITISSNAAPADTVEYVQIKSLDFDFLENVVGVNSIKLPKTAFSSSNWSLVAGSEQIVLNKLKSNSVPLGQYVGGKIQYGIKTGFNEAFFIDKITRDKLIMEDNKSAEIIKSLVVGDDVRKYTIDFQERYLIWTYVGVPINNYPAIYKHLHGYEAQLEKRYDKGDHWWELRHCSYYADFERPKIIYPVIAMNSRFTLDEDGHYTNDKTFFIPRSDSYLLALLNSRLVWSYLKNICSVLGDADDGGRLELRTIHVETVPIRRINFTLSPEQRAYYLEKASNLYAYCLDKHDQDCVLGFVDHHLAMVPEESDVVHDLLAMLAEQMIRLNKEKRAAQRAFLDWLVATLKLSPDKDGRQGIDALTGKSKLLDYPGDYQKGAAPLATGELLEMLQKNKARLGVSLSDSALVDRVKREYEASLERVLPLKERLERTDRLIDAVVYRLYGLTEEEIAVVEGKE
ncbi:MAG TPA: Eco57I restriction-modification methylase domain-containing protein, partial [Candidatus Dormibacteraeota bacterium]|nr:Eco57I restriction-modification methylase domain-containing protein [Candidatus Dormibacteraeota bacterium]